MGHDQLILAAYSQLLLVDQAVVPGSLMGLTQPTSVNSPELNLWCGNVARSSQALGKVAKLVEIHVHLNRLCCELAQERPGMLASQEKMSGVPHGGVLREREGAQPAKVLAWLQRGRGAVLHYAALSLHFQDKVLANYHLKNPEFIHLIRGSRQSEHSAQQPDIRTRVPERRG
ncbi:hypothetical protein DPEC_G00379110 [Dallia pectoralis]|nr:hypothetical protein DPEC_G00379110 [Dallia pectoralis]